MPAATDRQAEFTVTLGVWFAAATSNEMEDHALTIQEAVDTRAEGIALGAAVACTKHPPQAEVEVIFTVPTVNAAEACHRVALVLSVIEAALPVTLDGFTASIGRDDGTNRGASVGGDPDAPAGA